MVEPSRETASLRWALEVVGTLHAGGLDYGAVAQFDDDSGFDPALLPKPETNSFDRDNLDRYLQRRLRRLDRLIDSLRG